MAVVTIAGHDIDIARRGFVEMVWLLTVATAYALLRLGARWRD